MKFLQNANRKQKIGIAVVFLFVIAILVCFFIINVIVPNNNYRKATELRSNGEYFEAYQIFKELGDYKDSKTQLKITENAAHYDKGVKLFEDGEFTSALEIFQSLGKYKDCDRLTNAAMENIIKSAGIGDRVYFGRYEQDNNTKNGKELIAWKVIEENKNAICLMSEKILDAKPYHSTNSDITWELSSLRKWLNSDFYANAFTEKEKKCILEQMNQNEGQVFKSMNGSSSLKTDGGKKTMDKVYLLSCKELNKLDPFEIELKVKPTAYAISNGVSDEIDGYGRWWLRTPGMYQYHATFVAQNGEVSDWLVNSDFYGVRPVIWINK